MSERDTLSLDSSFAKAWRGFKPGAWQQAIDLRSFIQTNMTPYEGDDSFLAGATPRTTAIWNKLFATGALPERAAAPVLSITDAKIDTGGGPVRG